MPRFRKLILAAAIAALAVPGVAQANEYQASIVMDDDLLIYRDDSTRDAALRRLKGLGADYVRITVLWRVVAENARSTKARDKRFRELGADDPRAYPRLNWDRFDRLARACITLDIGCYFNITGPGPEWGHTKAPRSQARNRRTWIPKERQFYAWVKAVGKRYSGTYRDENDGKGFLPKVKFWSLWNEPGQAGWLSPQWWKGKPYSPHLYRKLYIFGRRALESTGHGGDIILIGETSPTGSSRQTTRAAMRPKKFIREMFCMDDAGNPYGGADARSRRCSDFDKYGPIRATAWAHHPYTKRLAPQQRESHPDSLTMANIGELGLLLDDISAKTARVAPGMSIASTEFGYETNPPDPYSGIDVETQATWLNIGDLLAFKDPRIIAQSQFLLRDVAPLSRHRANSKAFWFTYQSGLFDLADNPKPAATAFGFPFLAFSLGVVNPETGAVGASIWGQLKFLPNNISPENPQQVAVQWRPADGSFGHVQIGEPITVTNPLGFFEGTVEVPGPGYVRMFWSGAHVPPEAASREFGVG